MCVCLWLCYRDAGGFAAVQRLLAAGCSRNGETRAWNIMERMVVERVDEIGESRLRGNCLFGGVNFG